MSDVICLRTVKDDRKRKLKIANNLVVIVYMLNMEDLLVMNHVTISEVVEILLVILVIKQSLAIPL